MYTKETLINDLHNMGLTGKEAIMVHSSMKSIGEVEVAEIKCKRREGVCR
mgnify:CR=1 FL=1